MAASAVGQSPTVKLSAIAQTTFTAYTVKGNHAAIARWRREQP